MVRNFLLLRLLLLHVFARELCNVGRILFSHPVFDCSRFWICSHKAVYGGLASEIYVCSDCAFSCHRKCVAKVESGCSKQAHLSAVLMSLAPSSSARRGDQRRAGTLSNGSVRQRAGWLVKRGGSIKTWRRRWCVVRRGELRYSVSLIVFDVVIILSKESLDFCCYCHCFIERIIGFLLLLSLFYRKNHWIFVVIVIVLSKESVDCCRDCCRCCCFDCWCKVKLTCERLRNFPSKKL